MQPSLSEPGGAASTVNQTVHRLVPPGEKSLMNGIFSMTGVETWERISSIGPLRGPATASVVLNVGPENGSYPVPHDV